MSLWKRAALIAKRLGYHHELNLNRELYFPSSTSLGNQSWKPPNTVVLARNPEGEIVGAETYLFKDVADTFVAEARACERALILAVALGFRRIIVEGDSLTVIKSIKKKQNDKSILRPITQYILSLETGFEEISYLFVPRIANNTAHTLAMEGRRRHAFRVWSDGVPESVQTSALKDWAAWNSRP
ncbi:glycine, alanine and asparagine-rich protein-like [Gossypium australe]|uniref:Glycine, alanine and asparagine-rich protein-like n=1 Tax=Gossypium australe TaxID=47621 RepID=A0A5B6VRN0_9ROSI|nr:glycine, alanine and asparagine-rich protein-like [Gossypium australe]